MKTRLVAMAALLAVTGLLAGACGGDDTSETGAEKTSDSRDATTDNDSGSDDTPDQSIPDFGDIGGDMGDCLEVAGVYFTLALAAVQGEEGAAKAQAQAEELKTQLPDEFSDDIDLIADTFGSIAQDGILDGAAALDDPEFTAANERITEYLQTTCTGG